MNWFNEPPSWTLENGRLKVVTGHQTDFWRVTHYGFIRDNGHLYYRQENGDFVAEVRFRGDYQALYDQAGLMLRSGPEHWLKAGIEYTDNALHLSAVVTLEHSDWSVLPLNHHPPQMALHIIRHGTSVRVLYAEDQRYRMLRLAYFPPGPVWVGPMCCSPQRAGFVAEFDEFTLRPLQPEDLDLHGE